MVSGHHIRLKDNDSLEKLSDRYRVPKWAIEEANPGKKYIKGEWIFIPMKRGILDMINKDRQLMTSSGIHSYLNSGEFLWPVPSSHRISSKYGRRWGRLHEGIDISAKKGSHILAANDGVVVYSGKELGGYGNITVLAHKYGFFTIYAHAYKNYTRKGEKVSRGQVIAKIGNSGRSTGPHLHFEIRKNSKSIDPLKYLSRN